MTKIEMRNSKLEDTPSSVLTPVRDFKDLDAWKLARTLRILIYALLKKLPVEERFALNSQLRRAAQSTEQTLPKVLDDTHIKRTFNSAGRPGALPTK
ncbi:MAG: four helix bundle protein [Candidatus Acidiferrum sp.]|jgi:hypothetical protein